MEAANAAPAPLVFRFRGWVPTVSGRLSFSVIGRTEFPTRAIYANISDRKCRFLAVCQQSDVSDAIIPRTFIGITGNFVFILLAKTDDTTDQFTLSGECFIFHDIDAWEHVVLPDFQRHQDFLRRYNHATQQHLISYASHSHNRILDICRSHASFIATLSLSRRGTITVSANVPNTVSLSAPRLPEDPQRREQIIHSLAAQIYVFIKNISHHHQHHDPTTDIIIDLHTLSANDDLSWRLDTLYAMYRTVIEYKRIPHSSSFNDCTGIISYANTFTDLCIEELGAESAKILPKYYGANTIESIKATQARIERELLIKRRRQDTIRNTLLAILSITLSFTGLLRLTRITIDVKPDPLLIALVTWTISHATYAVAGFVLLIMAISLSSRARYTDRLPRFGLTLMRVVQVFKPEYVALGLAVLSLILAAWATFLALH
jgi:hypothetical protein